MAQKYVYLVMWTGDNPAGIVATTDRERLVDLFSASLGNQPFNESVGMLRMILCKPDAELAESTEESFGHPLSRGWGGPVLHVVPLL